MNQRSMNMKTRQKFNVGNHVIWESSGRVKEGRILAVIPAFVKIQEFNSQTKKRRLIGECKKFEKYTQSKLSDGKIRTHESYLVLVKEKYLYWPVVSMLKLREKENKGK